MIEERTKTTQDVRVFEWLKERRATRGDREGALELAEEIFRRQPSFERYAEVRGLAQELGRWDDLWPALHAQLQKAQQLALLVQIYLDEKEVDLALQAVQSDRPSGVGYSHGYGYTLGSTMQLEVAKAAEETHPREAIEIYRRHVEGLIAQRSRSYYYQAAALLQRVRTLYERLDEQDVWARYVADLRERNRSLRALKEELAAAGL